MIYLIIINLFTFFLFGMDKNRARKRKWRIPEKTLFFLAAIGGSLGAWGGMYCFRHKTKHASFVYGIPLIFLFQCIAIYFIYKGVVIS